MFIQLLAKILLVQHAPLIIRLFDQLVDIFGANDKHPSYKRVKTLHRFVIFTENVLKYGIIAYVLALLSYFAYPIYMYLHANEIVACLPVYIPYVDETTILGYAILIVFHVISMLLAFFGSTCCDFTFTLIIMNVPAMAYLFGATIDELNEQLMAPKRAWSVIKARLRNILLQRQEVVELRTTVHVQPLDAVHKR